MNHYQWGNINKATKLSTSLVLLISSTIQGNMFVLFLDILNYLMSHSKSDKWILYNFFYFLDINMF